MVKYPPANAGGAEDMGLIPGLERSPGGGNSNPLQYSCLENPRQRSLVGCSPWDCKRVRHNLATKQQHTIERGEIKLFLFVDNV